MTINPETLPPLEVSVTGIEHEEADNTTQDPSASQNGGSHSQQGLNLSHRDSRSFPLHPDGSQESPGSSRLNNSGYARSRRTTSVLHKYWDAFQQTVSPTIGFEAPAITTTDEAQRAAAHAPPLHEQQEEEEEEDQPRVHHHHGKHRGEALAHRVSRSRHQHKQSLTKAALAQLTHSTSLSDDAPNGRSPSKRNISSLSQSPAKPPFQRNNSAASTASKLSILAVDRDFDQLLTSSLQPVPSDGLSGGAGSGSHHSGAAAGGGGSGGGGPPSREGTPRNSSSAKPGMKQAGNSHSLDSSGAKPKQLAPPPPAVLHHSGTGTTTLQHSQSAMSYPPPQAQHSPALEKSNTPSSRAVLDELYKDQSPSTDTSSSSGSRLVNWFFRAASFLHPQFEPSLERAFKKESWMMRKAAAVASSVLLVCLWITYAASSTFTHTVERVLFYGIDLPFSLLMILAILFECARFSFFFFSWSCLVVAHVRTNAASHLDVPGSTKASASSTAGPCLSPSSSPAGNVASSSPPTTPPPSVRPAATFSPSFSGHSLSLWYTSFCSARGGGSTSAGSSRGLELPFGPLRRRRTKRLEVRVTDLTFVLCNRSSSGIDAVNLVNVVLFQCAILWTSLLRERSERHLFILNQRVRKQIEQTRQVSRIRYETCRSAGLQSCLGAGSGLGAQSRRLQAGLCLLYVR